jgi:hypothetical protein
MKATAWTTWERYLPSTNVQTRTRTFALCLKPWDQILAEEGIDERMKSPEQLWRTWDKYLPTEREDVASNMRIYSRKTNQESVFV